ncbi:CDP-alcohol phosphatidyltransferase family protein [Winogradskyella sp. 3972H.M.0a.05]|uniref:CDP-alcohol phosphatidyltransferase family protein n=1 Tax=Winogradskyella sp. 3972H.M.0a.05 TaxID=2950277 RepID=UPI00339A8DDF
MSLTKQIPNLVTLLNLLSGCIAMVFAVNNNFVAAAFFVCLGIFFDFFDGLLARLLKAQSPLGIQLDSLADLVTSGVVPGVIMYKLLLIASNSSDVTMLNAEWSTSSFDWSGFRLPILPLIGFFITLASAYRLAKFNIDEDQQDYFKGLPVPANTLMIIALPLVLEFQNNEIATSLILNQWFLIGLTLVSCYLLNSNIKLVALKFKTWDLKTNMWRYILVVASAILLATLQFMAIPVIIIVYIILSIFHFNTENTK